MSAQSDFTKHVEALMRDPLAAVRNVTGRVIGYVGDAPVELILAAGATPVRLRGIPGPTPNAERYLESSFAPDVRSIAEQWLAGELDLLSAVVFPRSNDSAQRLYYYLCELQRVKRVNGPQPLLFDSSTLSRASNLAHTLDSVGRLASALGVDHARLPAALARTTKRSQLSEQIALKRREATSVRGSDAFQVASVHETDWSEPFDLGVVHWLSSAETKSYARRLVFIGSAPPDARFHLAVERADAVFVHEAIDTEYAEIARGSDALQAIAARHHAAATLAQRMLRSVSYSVELARHTRADGAVLWAIEEDEALPWEISRQADTLRDAHIPTLLLTREQWNAGSQVLDRVTEFARTLRVSV